MMHPIVGQLSPNEEQRPAVLARSENLVVTAGAGTGKTRTLVARYLSLLASETPLRSIVAITFTQKAAQEMRNRIRAVMYDYLNQPTLAPEERRYWDTLYNELDAGRIGTIHNLCSEILRAHPAEAGIDPRFDVLDEGQAGILQQDAIDEAMAWAVDDREVVTLFALLGEWNLRQTIESLMHQRLAAETSFASLPADLWSYWIRYLLPPIQAFIDESQVRAAFTELEILRQDGTLDRAEAAGDKLAQPLRQLLSQWDELMAARNAGDWGAVSTGLRALRQYMKLLGSKGAWAPANPRAIIKELQQYYDETLDELVGGGINLALDQMLAEAMPALWQVFGQTSSVYRRLKQERQALDFDDLEDLALRLLAERPEVCERWQGEVQALLVDEYQDTNDRQRRLVNLLNSDADKLFIVGDAKQSIYRFRGAEVAVFREERNRIEFGGGRGYTLATSYRAHQELVSGLNDLLRPILGDEEDPARPWREPFAPLAYYRQESRKGFDKPFIELQLTVGSKSDGALRRAAAALAGQMVELVERQDDGLSYRDFAVLCRASTSFGSYEDAFDEANVPYLTVAGRGFYDRPEIRDLLNALQTLADPTDDLALIGFLRSPVMGLSDLELYQLIQESKKTGQTRSLWQWIKQSEKELLSRPVELITKLHNQAGRIPVAGLLKSLLEETDYRAALLQAGYPRPARNVAKLLRDAHASGIVSVGEFLDYVEGLQTAAAREGEARATAGDVVRIMTVHAAKGLEFPVVIIGDINHSRRFRNDLLVDPQWGVLPPLTDEEGRLPGLYRLLSNWENDQEEAEAERLFYVAATRAQEKLILNGCIRLTNSGKPGWLKGWLKQVAGPLQLGQQTIDYDPNGSQAIQLDLTISSMPVAGTIFEPAYVPAQAKPAAGRTDLADSTWSAELIESLDGSRLLEEKELELFKPSVLQRVWSILPQGPKSEAPAWIVGRLVHDALALWRFPGPDFDAWVRSRAREYGLVDENRLDKAAKRTTELLARFRQHRLYDGLLNADRCLHEVPYSFIDKAGETVQGLIDILYQKSDRWTLVEIKTDKISQQTRLKQHLTENGYFYQVKRYAEAVERTIGQRPQTILCLLDCEQQIYLDYDNSLAGWDSNGSKVAGKLYADL